MKALAVILLCLLPLNAMAQERRGAAAGRFDFWVLALSWSPTWCAERRDRRDDAQCVRQRGFVVHGLWPQYARGFPSYCGTDPTVVSREAMRPALGLMPSEGLARYQWRKHGTCSGLGPSAYFNTIGKAAQAIRLPAAMAGGAELPHRLRPDALVASFVQVNPGLRREMLAVACEGGALTEVRICLSRTLQFQPCPQVAARTCRQREISVPKP
ncbi:ribonuclease [Agaricicola taiwanensis]|uniref:Ribonuclease n=1 Tax=Agaricicola taiwanensis TaxID=591372 RepID=A0A8J2VUI5_9RHOB|nr:ribonuclease T2 [Agaricicola taiwanensis]GGE40381.1 ribonuclease [Agaricicola taiwanensis]